MKGIQNEECNRTACQKPDSAHYYNHSTRAWYCGKCAHSINRMNPESHKIYGHELCTHESSEHTIKAINKDQP